MSLRTLEAQGADGHEEEHAHQVVSMQYENIEQQNETYIVGMWSFLVTEIMFFGALFLIYSLYRVMFFNTYLEAHQFLNVTWGTVNTTVLLLSSWSMVMAVNNGQKGRRTKVLAFLTVTQLCALAFLCVKAIEYSSKFKEGLFPNARFNYAKALEESHANGAHEARSPRHEQAWRAFEEATKGEKAASAEGGEESIPQPRSAFSAPGNGIVSTAGMPVGSQIREARRVGTWANFQRESNKARIFFSIYFTMTGLHGVHVLIGMLLMGAMMKFYYTRRQCVEDYIPLELIGLYWHFVDIVWIFLFPLMYLIS